MRKSGVATTERGRQSLDGLIRSVMTASLALDQALIDSRDLNGNPDFTCPQVREANTLLLNACKALAPYQMPTLSSVQVDQRSSVVVDYREIAQRIAPKLVPVTLEGTAETVDDDAIRARNALEFMRMLGSRSAST